MRKSINRLASWLPLPIALGILLVSGVVHGLWTDRWVRLEDSSPFDETQLAKRIATIGEWESGPLSIDSSELAAAGISRYVARRYVHRSTRDEIVLLLVWGRPGPIAAHTPVVCFQGTGSQMVGDPVKHPVHSGSPPEVAEFWTARFRRTESPVPDYLRVFWAWNANGMWQAADNPRFSFAHYPALYKLYVVRHLAKPDEPAQTDPGSEFLQSLLPKLEDSLFPRS
jgi:hypothetical protein